MSSDPWADFAGALDDAAGSADEEFHQFATRNTDQYVSGTSADRETVEQVSQEGAVDHYLGSTDESWGRQFDSTAGGGFADEAANAAGDAATAAVPNLTTKQKAALAAGGLLFAALVLRPYAEIGAGVT